MNSVVVLNYDSAQDLLCSYCHEEFKTNENRRYQILIETNNKITTLSAIHINLCLPRAEEEAALAKIEAVHLPMRHWVKSFQELETKFPFIAKLVDAYEGAAIYTSTGTGYVLEFPISLGNVPIVKELFKFQQFKAFFTAVQIREIALDGIRALDYPAQLKKALLMLLQPLGCTLFVWIHQVTGTNNCFRIILAIQANESDLVSVYQSSLFQVWTNTVIDSNHLLVQKLTDPVGKALAVFEEKLESTAKALQLKPVIKSVKSLDVSHTGQFNGVYHHEYNVQQCQGEMYVLPKLENIVSDSKTPVLCFSGNSSEYLPIFYDTTVTDMEKELSQAKLTKQPLTNYQSLLALFPQAINRPA